MIEMSMQGDETAPTNRRSLLLIDADPLLRWSIVTYLRKAFDIQVAETLNEGRGLLVRRRFDAIILPNSCSHNAIQDWEALARLQNEGVTIVRLATGVEDEPRDPGIMFLEKPFELASLLKALNDTLPRISITQVRE